MASEIAGRHDWIHVIEQEHFYGQGYSHQNLALGVNDGCRYGLSLPRIGPSIQLIGKIDATVDLGREFFERMIEEMDSDKRNAFVCGQERRSTFRRSVRRHQ